MIILEGADGSGKSTLGEKLSTVFKIPVNHFGGPPKTQEEVFNRMRTFFDTAPYQLKIWDRISCISDQVYGPVLRNLNYFTGTTYVAQLKDLQPLIIYCRPRNNHFHRFLDKAGKEHDDAAHIAGVNEKKWALIWGYDKFIEQQVIPAVGDRAVVRYDFTSPNGSLIFDVVYHYLKWRWGYE